MTTLSGFQGSENSGVEVSIYRRGLSVGGVERPGGTLRFTGRTGADTDRSIIDATISSVTTLKSMAMSGQFTVVFKVQDDHKGGFLDAVQDDDWLDITFTRHAKKWHVMRGLIEEVRRSQSVSGSGATTTSYTVIGRDFQKIFESTSIWFNINTLSETLGGMSEAIFDTLTIGGSVSETVEKFLFGFLRLFRQYGRANWQLPDQMPNARGAFADSVDFDISGFSNSPSRQSISESFLDLTGGIVWSLAKNWSDPMFCELYTDLVTESTAPNPAQGSSDVYTRMAVILRDKPFPVVDRKAGPAVGKNSPWFSLPLFVVPRQNIVSSDLGVQGYERFNAFFFNSNLAQETLGALAKHLEAPLWDRADILAHGLRRYEASTNYEPYIENYREATDTFRARLRDWYCLNPLFLNGSIQLGIGMPQIRIGTRLLVPGESGEQQNETFYIEQVTHSWSLSQGMKTNLGVTRGWRGTDASQMAAVSAFGSRYTQEGNF